MFYNLYDIRRLHSQMALRKDDAGISRLADDDCEDPDSGYCIDATPYLPTGAVRRNRFNCPTVDCIVRS